MIRFGHPKNLTHITSRTHFNRFNRLTFKSVTFLVSGKADEKSMKCGYGQTELVDRQNRCNGGTCCRYRCGLKTQL